MAYCEWLSEQTGKAYRLPLLTYNRKDFRYLPEILLPELDSLLL
jgi:hypothetical protein